MIGVNLSRGAADGSADRRVEARGVALEVGGRHCQERLSRHLPHGA